MLKLYFNGFTFKNLCGLQVRSVAVIDRIIPYIQCKRDYVPPVFRFRRSNRLHAWNIFRSIWKDIETCPSVGIVHYNDKFALSVRHLFAAAKGKK